MYLLLGFVDVFLWLIQQPCNPVTWAFPLSGALASFTHHYITASQMSSNALSTLRGESGTEPLGSFHRLEDCLILPW